MTACIVSPEEVESLRAQKACVRNEPKLDPTQHKRLMDLQQTVTRQAADLARLRTDHEAARSVAQRATNARLAEKKQYEEDLTHENIRWQVALQMRDECIDALRNQVADTEDELAEAKAYSLTVAAASSEAKARNTKVPETAALAVVREREATAQQDLNELRSRSNRAEAELAKALAELRDSRVVGDELLHKVIALETEREDAQLHRARGAGLQAECTDLQRRCEGQKDIIETQSKSLEEAVAQKGK